jgi:competence protein ComEC
MNLKIHFWDVGQGDASVITLPDGRLIIIDTGPPDSPLLQWLAGRNERIYAIVLTHHHDDHAGALIPILECCRGRIQFVFYSQSSHGNSSYERKILTAIWRRAQKGEFQMVPLQVSAPNVQGIFAKRDTEDISLYCCHPDPMTFIQNQVRTKPQPNKVSAIICLDINSNTEVIWPGDVPMQTLAQVCRGKQPAVLVGPHHGGPETRSTQSFLPSFDAVSPTNVFVSVGTDNTYQHPLKHDFVLPHVKRDRHLCCSQLKHCDSQRVARRQSVMTHHLPMGLLPPVNSNAVSCRGPMELSWDSSASSWKWDQWHAVHRRRVAQLKDPWCLLGQP